VAVDKRPAKRELESLLRVMNGHRHELAAFRDRRDAAGVTQCEQVLKYNYARIRSHCARHDLELPHDVPSEDAQ